MPQIVPDISDHVIFLYCSDNFYAAGGDARGCSPVSLLFAAVGGLSHEVELCTTFFPHYYIIRKDRNFQKINSCIFLSTHA